MPYGLTLNKVLKYALVAALSSACIEQQDFTPLGELGLSSAANLVELREGTTASIMVRVVRGTGLTREIEIRAQNLPPGIHVEETTIPAGVDEGLVQVSLGTGVVLGRDTPLELVAESLGKQASTTVTVLPIGRRASIDPSFGTNGLVAVGSNGTDCRTYPIAGEKLLVNVSAPNTIFLVQLDRAGNVDPAFASIGYVYLEQVLPGMPRERYSPVKVAIQNDGKILIATSADDPLTPERPDALVLMRLHPDGRLDTSYDSDGVVRINGALRTYSLTITTNDNAVLVYGNGGTTVLAKISQSGTILRSSQTWTQDTFACFHTDMIAESNGRVVLPLFSRGPNSSYPPVLVRFTTELTLDPNFGRDGVMSAAVAFMSMLRTSNGRYVGLGQKLDFPRGRNSIHVAIYDEAWSSAPGFEDGGITFVNWPSGALHDAVETRDGILAIGAFDDGRVQAAHILADGTVDQTFGAQGLTPMPATSLAGPVSLAAGGEHTAYYSYPRADQPCQVYRVWR